MTLNVAHVAGKTTFTKFELTYINAGGRTDFNFVNVQDFLIERGYFVYRTSVTKHIYIRILKNIVREVGTKDIKDEILEFIKAEEPRNVYEFALKNINKVANDEYLETLPAKEVNFRKDNKNTMQIYFQNCIVEISGTNLKTYPYEELPKDVYIWESQIIQRNFNDQSDFDCNFRTFLWNIANREEPRYQSLCSMIGYVLHNYKNPAYCPAVILNDEVISDNPEGGTGKGLLVKAIEKFLKIVTIEGKTFSFDKNFVYQRVNSDTKVLCFQDVNKTFDFERLFSVLTEGIDVEKKGRDSILIGFEDAPKVIITTNYAIRGSGNSHERRRFELEISQHYNKKNTPYSEFGIMMFHEWNAKEWHKFDRFILDCCQFYLRMGLVEQVLVNLPEKKLIAETSPEFIEFMEDSTPETGNQISRGDFYKRFKDENPTSKIASKTFYSYVRFYAKFHKLPFKEGKTNGIRYFSF